VAMSRKLVTVATFDQSAQARLAQNAIQSAGIQATVNDESLVAMDWLLSNAVGGVKIQVWEEDADRAVEVLEGQFGADGAGFGAAAIDPEELASEAEAAGRDEPASGIEPRASEPEPPTEYANEREEYARRLVFTSLLGLVLFPVAVYAVYLLLNAAFGQGELSARGRFNLVLGGLMAFSGMIELVMVYQLMFC